MASVSDAAGTVCDEATGLADWCVTFCTRARYSLCRRACACRP